jgi:putative phosphoesterase
MKVAFISDIHSNYFYLERVLQYIDELCIDSVYCLGDLVGYYDNPNKVIDEIRNRGILCVKGNHENYLLFEADYDSKKENVYQIKKHRDMLSDVNLHFLQELPSELDLVIAGKTFFMTHSLPSDSDTHVYETNALDRTFTLNYDYYCYGHTHIPLNSYFYGTHVINPGSVGQPRDYTRKPSFAVVDIENDNCKIIKVPVDYLEYSDRLQQNGYDSSLIDVLNRNKDG